MEFQPYRNLPHAEVVSLNSSPELSRSVLLELLEEKERRNLLFAKNDVRDFTAYRAKGFSLPRILLLVDEYQELFENDPNGSASTSLLQLAQQGRSAGIHMLLGSQQFGAPGMLNQSAIFGNLHLRMAMKMDYSKVQALTEFGPRGKSLIRSCDLPGKIVVNDKSGEDSGNQYGKVALISPEQQGEVVNALRKHGKREKWNQTPILFEGAHQPRIINNPQISRFANSPTVSPIEVERIARLSIPESGFGVLDWTNSERPVAAWVGQEFNVRGGSPVVVRRTFGHNIAIIGSHKKCRQGILSGIVSSVVSIQCNSSVEFVFFDRALPDDACPSGPSLLHNELLNPLGFESSYFDADNELDAFLDALTEEISTRRKLPDEGRELRSIFAVLNEPNRCNRSCPNCEIGVG